jgi:hypothetical protein
MSENKTQANEKASSYLKVAEVARLLRVNPTTVRSWIVKGLLDATPLPHRGKRQEYRITPAALDRAIGKTNQAGTLSLVKNLDASTWWVMNSTRPTKVRRDKKISTVKNKSTHK